MGGTKEIHQDGNVTRQAQWVLMKDENDHDHDRYSELVDSDFEECSDDSIESESSSSSDMIEDASSSSTSSSSYGPLYELSELMAQLPIKRGLSKYYQGQSQSFASLASVKSLEDLAKRGDFISYNKRMKPNKSFGDSKKYGPKPTIAKKTSRAKRESTNLVTSLIRSSVQKHF